MYTTEILTFSSPFYTLFSWSENVVPQKEEMSGSGGTLETVGFSK